MQIHPIVQVCDVRMYVCDEILDVISLSHSMTQVFGNITTRCRTMGAIAPSSHKRASTGMSKTSQDLLVEFAFNAAS